MKETERKRKEQERVQWEKCYLDGQNGSLPPTVDNVKKIVRFYAKSDSDAAHIMAQIQKESGDIKLSAFNFRTQAVNTSDGGSAGLCQIHPSRAAYNIALAAGIMDYPRDRQEQSRYLKKNWVSSVKLMAAFRDYAKGHVLGIGKMQDAKERDKFMLAAYNMGETRLNEIIRQYRAVTKKTPQSWNEMIKTVNVNRITQGYVSKITAKAKEFGYK